MGATSDIRRGMQKFNYPSTSEEEKSSHTDDDGHSGVEEEVVSARFTPHSPIGEKTDKNKKEGRKGRKELVCPLMSRDVVAVVTIGIDDA